MSLPSQLKKCARVLLFLCAFFILGCKTRYNATFDVGSTAPDFAFVLSDGTKKHLSDYRGKPVVLHFWASWCDVCKSENPRLSIFSQKLGSDVTLLSVGVLEDPKVFQEYVRTAKIPFLSVTPEDPSVADTYKLSGVPETFVLDKEGRFVLIQEPRSGEAKVRFLGPVQWDDEAILAQILRHR